MHAIIMYTEGNKQDYQEYIYRYWNQQLKSNHRGLQVTLGKET